MISFCESLEYLQRRPTDPVRIGQWEIGGNNPIAVQTMCNVPTSDTRACVDQIVRIHGTGCRIVRLTTPSVSDAENLANIRASLERLGITDVALVADVHFLHKAALAAAVTADKVRINPGNFPVGDGNFRQLISLCRNHCTSLRIGVNHGSLSERIVSRWGDTPRGMVESAMEFLEECRSEGFDQVVVSMKSSNVRVMVHAYRLLAAEMYKRNMRYPLHLGVTEAGNGIEGRIKSSVGIGTLLADGLGDTIRVSLTEAPENEIPVAEQIINRVTSRQTDGPVGVLKDLELYSPFEYKKLKSDPVESVGGDYPVKIIPEYTAGELSALRTGQIAVITPSTANPVAEWRCGILNMRAGGDNRPVILSNFYDGTDPYTLAVEAATDFGPLFIDGLADGIVLEGPAEEGIKEKIVLDILQAARIRMSSTEYISCPGCGRTMFDLEGTLERVKEATSHLKHLKIGIMGCVVNGPGEMADADYGYVGAGKGVVILYKGQEVKKRGVAEQDAVLALVNLIKEEGDWIEPLS